jgi:23S rRNA pseudouridine1911/1915/1917 synthase
MSNKKTNSKLPDIDILYEDKDCAVVNKPPNLMVHSDGKAPGPFLADWILEHYPEAKDVGDPMTGKDGEPLERGGIVHRLDRDTSGALIIAKTPEGHASIKKQFQYRTVEKKYLTFVWGEMTDEFGTIDRPIGRSGKDFRKWSATRGKRGDIRDALTYWVRIAIAQLPEAKAKDIPKDLGTMFSLIQAEPKTGRTHQIRVHLNAINRPVVGDIFYAPKRPMVLGFDRLALHSWSIQFKDLKDKTIKVMAPIPADFINACKELGIPVPEKTHS